MIILHPAMIVLSKSTKGVLAANVPLRHNNIFDVQIKSLGQLMK